MSAPPAPEDGAPTTPPDASTGEENEPASDEPVVDSTSDTPDTSTGQGKSDATPATEDTPGIPEGDGGNREADRDNPPPLLDREEDSDSDSDYDEDEANGGDDGIEGEDLDRAAYLAAQEETEADKRLIGV